MKISPLVLWHSRPPSVWPQPPPTNRMLWLPPPTPVLILPTSHASCCFHLCSCSLPAGWSTPGTGPPDLVTVLTSVSKRTSSPAGGWISSWHCCFQASSLTSAASTFPAQPGPRWHILQTHCYCLAHFPVSCPGCASSAVFASHITGPLSLLVVGISRASLSRKRVLSQLPWVSLVFSALLLLLSVTSSVCISLKVPILWHFPWLNCVAPKFICGNHNPNVLVWGDRAFRM